MFSNIIQRRAVKIYALSFMLTLIGLFLWATGLDITLQKTLAEHDVQWVNNIWRIVGEMGLGRWQWLFCLLGVTYLIHRKTLLSYPKTFYRIFIGTFYIWLRGLIFIFKPVTANRFFFQREAKYVQQLPLKIRTLAYAIPIMFWAGALCLLFKIILGRPRPKEVFWNNEYATQPLNFDAAYHSFPSGHTTTTFALLTVLLILFPKYKFLLIALACLTAWARVITITPHFLGDIFAGAGLGLATATFMLHRFNLIKNRP